METKMMWGEESELSGPRDYFRNSLLLREIEKNQKGKKILDFGAGSGHLILRLLEKGNTCLGIDTSKVVIDVLEEKVKGKFGNKVTTIKGDDKKLFKLTQKFDVVVSGEVLEHIKNEARAIEGFFKILKRDGICVVSVPANKIYWDINDDFSGHYRRYSKNELVELFRKSGFKILKAYYWGFPLSLIWHRLIYLKIIKNKIHMKKKYSGSKTFLGKLLQKGWLKNVLSHIFWLDELFNWTKLGGGLILVAKK